MNRLLNAMDELSEAITTVEDGVKATRIRVFLIAHFHKEETNLNQTDPNHPYMRFAKRGDDEGNRLRLFQAMQECLDEENHDLQAAVDLMFEVPDTPTYTATTTMLRRYMGYANEHRTSDSSDSDSD
jgi:hypothetical protein